MGIACLKMSVSQENLNQKTILQKTLNLSKTSINSPSKNSLETLQKKLSRHAPSKHFKKLSVKTLTKLSIKSYQETLHQKTLKRLSINKRSRNSLSNIQPNAQSLCIFPSCEQVGWSPSSQSLPAMSDFHKNWLEQAQCINAFAKQKHVRNPERATVLSDRLLTSQ